MGQIEETDPFQRIFKILGEVSGYAAGLLGYLAAVLGIPNMPRPASLSIAMMVLTTLLFARWRWQAIRRQKEKPVVTPHLFIPESARPKPASFWERQIDTIKSNSSKNYAYSLARRRSESSVLLIVLLFSGTWVGLKSKMALKEWIDNPLLNCTPPAGKALLRVVVADIIETSPQNTSFVEDRLDDFLFAHQDEGQFEVCRLNQTLNLRTKAIEAAKQNEADLLIWGRQDAIYEVHLEVPAWKYYSKTISMAPTQDASSYDFQSQEPAHLGYVAEITMSEILFLSGAAPLAQTRLNKALQPATDKTEAQKYARDFAQGFFLLGFFYDPNTDSTNPDTQQAIDNYSKALALQDDLDVARLNRSLLYLLQSQYSEALVDINTLIERKSAFQCLAYLNRANLQTDPAAVEQDLAQAIACDPAEGYTARGQARLEQNDFTGAVADLKQALILNPDEYFNYDLLGIAQLYAGQTDDARKTYQQIVPLLDEDARQAVLTDLQVAAQNDPPLIPVVDEISAALKAASLKPPATSP